MRKQMPLNVIPFPGEGDNANWNTHNLETLSQAFMNMLEKYGTNDPDEADEV